MSHLRRVAAMFDHPTSLARSLSRFDGHRDRFSACRWLEPSHRSTRETGGTTMAPSERPIPLIRSRWNRPRTARIEAPEANACV